MKGGTPIVMFNLPQ